MRTIDTPLFTFIPWVTAALLLNGCAAAPPDLRKVVPTADRDDVSEPSLPELRQRMHSPDQNLRRSAFDAAYRIGPAAVPLLAEMLRDDRVTNRRAAADLLIDLAPDTVSVQPSLRGALGDEDARVARDAARALGALGPKARPSVPSLAAALAHGDAHVRLYAAEALASVGAGAAAATSALARALHDPVPGVRWAACEALAGIGPPAAPAVQELTEALGDEVLYVRLCAAGALGSIGPPAARALPALKRAAADPALAAEAERATRRIAGDDATRASAAPSPADRAHRPTDVKPAQPAVARGDPPLDWDVHTGRNIIWGVELGRETFGRPVVADGVVYVGSDNAGRRNPAFREDCGVLLAFRAADGEFLGQDVSPRVGRGLREFLLPSTTSAPYVEGNRLYYLTAECQLRCLDTWGFGDGMNEGTYRGEPHRGEPHRGERLGGAPAADVVWELDLCARLGVFPHEACNSEVLPVGDLLIVCTSNGRNEGHTRVPSPLAPSLIAVDKQSGEVVWGAAGAGADVLHGQWCSPVSAVVNGRVQVLFGGGDGWLRAYDPGSGAELWRFDGNPKDAPWRPRPGVFSRCGIVASPACADGRVFVAMGEDPSHGDGPSLLHAVRPDGRGDVTDGGRLWTCDRVGRVVGTPLVNDGLLYVADLGGKVHCLDATTGGIVWQHDTGAPIWGCLLLAGGRLYAGNVDGRMTVLAAGRHERVLAQIEMDEPLYSRPAVVGDAMYVATERRLYRLEGGKPESVPNCSP